MTENIENIEAEAVEVEAIEESGPPPFPEARGGAFGPDMGHTRWDTRSSPLRPWREQLGLKLTGPYSRADRDAALELQEAAGLEKSGTVDRLTWEAAWA